MVEASSNETPCFWKFLRLFSSSHSNNNPILTPPDLVSFIRYPNTIAVSTSRQRCSFSIAPGQFRSSAASSVMASLLDRFLRIALRSTSDCSGYLILSGRVNFPPLRVAWRTGHPVARNERDPLGAGWSEHGGVVHQDRTRKILEPSRAAFVTKKQEPVDPKINRLLL